MGQKASRAAQLFICFNNVSEVEYKNVQGVRDLYHAHIEAWKFSPDIVPQPTPG